MFRFDQVMTVTLRGELFTQDQYPFQLKAVFFTNTILFIETTAF